MKVERVEEGRGEKVKMKVGKFFFFWLSAYNVMFIFVHVGQLF